MNVANNTNFHYRPNSQKTNDQIFEKLQKALPLAHFGGNFFKTMTMSRATSHGFLTPFQNLDKTNHPILSDTSVYRWESNTAN